MRIERKRAMSKKTSSPKLRVPCTCKVMRKLAGVPLEAIRDFPTATMLRKYELSEGAILNFNWCGVTTARRCYNKLCQNHPDYTEVKP